MNCVDKIRKEIQQYYTGAAIADSDETIISPNEKYRIEIKSFKQNKPNCNWAVTKINLFNKLHDALLFSFFVNDDSFFFSWITKNEIDYLLCAEDLCGGQTVIDLTNKKMASYTEDNDGFIWTKHLLSPDEKLLAVFGCGWGSAFFIIVYHFDNPMELPLKIAYKPMWTGYDIVEWTDNKSIRVKNSKYEEAILEI